MCADECEIITVGCSILKIRKGQVRERLVSTLEDMQIPSGTGPNVHRSKRPMRMQHPLYIFYGKVFV